MKKFIRYSWTMRFMYPGRHKSEYRQWLQCSDILYPEFYEGHPRYRRKIMVGEQFQFGF